MLLKPSPPFTPGMQVTANDNFFTVGTRVLKKWIWSVTFPYPSLSDCSVRCRTMSLKLLSLTDLGQVFVSKCLWVFSFSTSDKFTNLTRLDLTNSWLTPCASSPCCSSVKVLQCFTPWDLISYHGYTLPSFPTPVHWRPFMLFFERSAE